MWIFIFALINVPAIDDRYQPLLKMRQHFPFKYSYTPLEAISAQLAQMPLEGRRQRYPRSHTRVATRDSRRVYESRYAHPFVWYTRVEDPGAHLGLRANTGR
jgi:hypothetical protein